MNRGTPDSDDIDTWVEGNCAVARGAGWWFLHCSGSDLNGDDGDDNGIWSTGPAEVFDVQASHMLVKVN